MAKTKVAFLWDESFLWGLMAYRSFVALGLEPEIVSAAEVRDGALARCDLLFVPGGWASDKTVALGEAGREAVREFVAGGGSYMGFCGGAGLALDVDGGLALTHASRVPTRHRVPSFSGEVDLAPSDPHHAMWRGIAPPYRFHAWWPGQFHLGEGDGVRVLAGYASFGRDFCLADLTADDVSRYDGWEKWEINYGINLDPARLIGEPAIIEARHGPGRVLLSYLHLETPGCKKGNHALLNIMEYLKPEKRASRGKAKAKQGKRYPVSRDAVWAAIVMRDAASEFISFGERNFLWYWRNDWVLQWRRGVRGIEYSMLHGLATALADMLRRVDGTHDPEFNDKLIALRGRMIGFFESAKTLLMKERFAMMSGGVTSSIKSDDPEVGKLRERLFSSSKRFGGEFKAILNALDELLLATLKAT